MVIGGQADGRALVARRGIEEVPVWVWSLVLGYASLLLCAALWAIVERSRGATRGRERKAAGASRAAGGGRPTS
jgi:hypothetical protein